MKTKSLISFLIGITSFFSCSDKKGIVTEVSLEGRFVKIDANEGKWPRWMLGDYIYARDHELVKQMKQFVPLEVESQPAGWLKCLVRILTGSGRWPQTRSAFKSI